MPLAGLAAGLILSLAPALGVFFKSMDYR